MLLATVLALGAAVLHAGWNFAAKQADGDRYLVLLAQFVVAGLICLPLLIGNHVLYGLPPAAYGFAALSGLMHIPYVYLLARAYTIGDFSVSYPVARGGGAAVAAVGGVFFLADVLTSWYVLGIVIIVAGLSILAVGAPGVNVAVALMVALTIGAYSVLDAAGSRTDEETVAYIFATMVAGACANVVFALVTGRRHDLLTTLRVRWRPSILTGTATIVTYGMVVVAFRLAPVGYVTALRESSVVLAALAGWRLLGEGDHRRRISATVVVVFGILVLVLGG